jgi:predicted nucleotidyltransferase
VDDTELLEYLTGALADLSGVEAVALGGSRAQGTERVDSDWDLAIYYRGGFDPEALRALGWHGEATELGGWGGGVFNGGGWFEVDGRRVDVHYRDLEVVERVLAEAVEGRFEIEPLMFHLAGIPTYLLAAELAINRTLTGELPRPGYPDALRASAHERWAGMARLTLPYCRDGHAVHGHVAQTAAMITQAACYAGHGILAARGEWITNEKRLLTRADLGEINAIVAGLRADAGELTRAVDAASRLLDGRLAAVGGCVDNALVRPK